MKLINLAVCSIAACMLAGSCTSVDPKSIVGMHPKKEIVPMLKSASSEGNSVTFLYFSDLHGYAPNLERIVSFKEYYADWIDDAIHTGDGVICYMDNPNEWNNVPGAENILNVVGNHDCWKSHLVWAQTDKPYDATQQEAYQVVMVGEDEEHPFIANWGVIQPEGVNDALSPDYCACYYYKDYDSAKLRLVVLDCMHYEKAQDEWFRKTLGEASAKDYAVVGVTHYPAESGILDCSDSSYVIPADYSDAIQYERMSDEAFAAVDDAIEDGLEFVCWLSGHCHRDFIGFVADHTTQLQVCIAKSGEKDSYVAEGREVGTLNQDSFDLVTVNTEKGYVEFNRIGCSKDSKGRDWSKVRYDFRKGSVQFFSISCRE